MGVAAQQELSPSALALPSSYRIPEKLRAAVSRQLDGMGMLSQFSNISHPNRVAVYYSTLRQIVLRKNKDFRFRRAGLVCWLCCLGTINVNLNQIDLMQQNCPLPSP